MYTIHFTCMPLMKSTIHSDSPSFDRSTTVDSSGTESQTRLTLLNMCHMGDKLWLAVRAVVTHLFFYLWIPNLAHADTRRDISWGAIQTKCRYLNSGWCGDQYFVWMWYLGNLIMLIPNLLCANWYLCRNKVKFKVKGHDFVIEKNWNGCTHFDTS